MVRKSPQVLAEGALDDAFAAKTAMDKLESIFKQKPRAPLAEDKFMSEFKAEFLRLCERFDLPMPPAFNKTEQMHVGFEPDGKPAPIGVRLDESSLRDDPEISARRAFGSYVLGLGAADRTTQVKLSEMLEGLFSLDAGYMGKQPLNLKSRKKKS